jgi:hypothetical protein
LESYRWILWDGYRSHPQLTLENLAAGILGQAFQKIDLFRRFVAGQAFAQNLMSSADSAFAPGA